jgi:hypothetical protein
MPAARVLSAVKKSMAVRTVHSKESRSRFLRNPI